MRDHVLVFIAHGRRELVHVNVTANPTAAWVRRQMIEATPWGCRPRHLLHDHDAVYGRDFRQRARRIGIDAIATPVRSPRANAVVERLIGTLRRACLDHLIILDEHHLLWVLRELVAYYTQRSSASDAWVADPRAEATPDHRSDPVTAGTERAASGVRARRLRTAEVLPPDNRSSGVLRSGSAAASGLTPRRTTRSW